MLKRHGVAVRPRAVGADGRTVRFADGSELEVDAVIWATGYRPDHSWIDLPINGDDGRLRHRRGVSDVPGLYFLGLSWQHTRGSALLGFVADDAAFIAGQIDADREPSAAKEHRSRPADSKRHAKEPSSHGAPRASPRPRRRRGDRHVPDRHRRPSRRRRRPRSSTSPTATPSSCGSRRSPSGSATTPCA